MYFSERPKLMMNDSICEMKEPICSERQNTPVLTNKKKGFSVFGKTLFDGIFGWFCEAVSKVIEPVILNLFQDPNALYVRSRNKFGMTPIREHFDF